jgi:repressor LexA
VTIGEIIKHYRTANDLSMDNFGKLASLSKAYISILERGSNPRNNKPVIPSIDTLRAIAQAMNMDLNELINLLDDNQKIKLSENEIPEGFSPPPEMVLKPLVGKIACGTPILAEQNIEDYINVPKDVKCDFLLTCDGDSMIDAGIRSGDVVYLIKQPDIDYNGQIAAVRVDGEATLKKVFKYQDKVVLQPANANYEPLVYIKEEINDLVIEGIATGFTHIFIN